MAKLKRIFAPKKRGRKKAVRTNGKRSKFEADFDKAQSMMKLGGKYEAEDSKFKYVISAVYNPDFTFTKKDGTKMYIELKGEFDDEDRRKMLLVCKQNRNADIRIIFQNPKQKLSSARSSTTYHNWCVKHGIKTTMCTFLPEEWIEEIAIQ